MDAFQQGPPSPAILGLARRVRYGTLPIWAWPSPQSHSDPTAEGHFTAGSTEDLRTAKTAIDSK